MPTKTKPSCAPCADKPTPDFALRNCGTIWLFLPLTAAAHAWLDEHCNPDYGEHQYFGPNLVVEHRYVRDLVTYAINDGLTPP